MMGDVTTCRADCRKPTGQQMTHCPTCHRTFGGEGGFIKHRRPGGVCHDPAEDGMVERDRVWHGAPMSRAAINARQMATKRTKKPRKSGSKAVE